MTRCSVLQYLIESLVGVSDQQCPLIREVVVEIGDNLYSDVSLSRTRGTNHQGKTMLHPRQDGLHLSSRERHCIPAQAEWKIGVMLGRNI